MKESNMNKELDNNLTAIECDDNEMLREYDFSGGVRGKYADRYTQENNIILLDPDVSLAFPTSESVNEALRLLMKLAQQSVKKVAS